MTHSEFIPYHNFHIRFGLKDGSELSGVLFDDLISKNSITPDTVYVFVPTNKMIEWKQAEQKDDKEAMKSLEGKIDIRSIVWAERMRY